MSISAVFYTFGKRVNSTLQPTGSGTTIDVVLKTPTSMINPTIQLQTSNPTGYNYCYISYFSRYYFVGDWTCVHNDLWEVSLEVDTLASFKTGIGGSTQYVLRSASQYNGDIVDNLYPTKGNTDLIIGDYTPSGQTPFKTSGITYILGILNSNATHKFGAVQYYALTPTNIGDLMDYLMGTPSDTQGLGQAILQALNQWSPNPTPLAQFMQEQVTTNILQPMQYIVESYMLPYKPPVASSGQLVKANWFNLPGVYGDIISDTSAEFFIDSGDLDLPDHPQKNDRGPFLNLSPFMKYWLYLGPFGLYPLDPVTVYSNRSVTYSIDGDLMGNITCKLFVDGKQIDVLHANVKCNFPVAQTTMDVARAVGSAVNIGVKTGEAAAVDPVLGITTGISGIVSAAESLLPQMRSQGSQGTFVNVFDQFYSYGEAHWVIDDDNTQRGRPLCKPVQISTLSGFILVSDPDVSLACTAEENEKIKGFMSSGFFYE